MHERERSVFKYECVTQRIFNKYEITEKNEYVFKKILLT